MTRSGRVRVQVWSGRVRVQVRLGWVRSGWVRVQIGLLLSGTEQKDEGWKVRGVLWLGETLTTFSMISE